MSHPDKPYRSEEISPPAAQEPHMAVTKWSRVGHQIGVQSGDDNI